MVHGKITHRHTDHLAGWHSVQTNQRPTSFFPYFYAGCPSCCNPHNLSWLGSGTKYAGLHTQWLGLYYREFVCISVICPLLSADEGSVSSTTDGSIATLTAFISQQTRYVNTRGAQHTTEAASRVRVSRDPSCDTERAFSDRNTGNWTLG